MKEGIVIQTQSVIKLRQHLINSCTANTLTDTIGEYADPGIRTHDLLCTWQIPYTIRPPIYGPISYLIADVAISKRPLLFTVWTLLRLRSHQNFYENFTRKQFLPTSAGKKKNKEIKCRRFIVHYASLTCNSTRPQHILQSIYNQF